MPKSSKPRSRGRPAKLSREQILQCAMKMMQRSPGGKITMTGVAKALHTAPMSLYTHVKHRDDLMDGIAELVLGELNLEINNSSPWQQQVRDWLQAVHQHLSGYPQIVELLGQSKKVPVAWLRVHAPLVRSLKDAGLEKQQLAKSSQWAAQQVIGSLLLGFASVDREKVDADIDALAALTDEQRAIFADIVPYLEPETTLFSFTEDRIIDALERMIGE